MIICLLSLVRKWKRHIFALVPLCTSFILILAHVDIVIPFTATRRVVEFLTSIMPPQAASLLRFLQDGNLARFRAYLRLVYTTEKAKLPTHLHDKVETDPQLRRSGLALHNNLGRVSPRPLVLELSRRVQAQLADRLDNAAASVDDDEISEITGLTHGDDATSSILQLTVRDFGEWEEEEEDLQQERIAEGKEEENNDAFVHGNGSVGTPSTADMTQDSSTL